MSVEVIDKLKQKNDGTFKIIDLDDVDYDGTGKSAKEALDEKSTTAIDDNSTTATDKTLSVKKIHALVEQCVQKEEGKKLSSNDYTNAEKEKLSALENYDDTEIKSNIQTQKARIDNLSTLQEGSTTGDAELIDARISADGTNYENLGSSIRSQFNNVNDNFKDIITKSPNLINPNKCLVNMDWNGTNGVTLLADNTATKENPKYVLSDVINCKPGDVFTTNYTGYLTNFYGANKNGVFNVAYKNTFTETFTIPDECYSFRWKFTISNTIDETWKEKMMLVKGNTLPSEFEKYGISKLNKNIIIPQFESKVDIIKENNIAITTIDKPVIVLTFDGTAHDENSYNLIFPYLKEKDIPFTVFCSGSDDNNVIARYHNIKNYGGEVQFYNGQPATTYEGTTNYIEQYTQFKQNYDNFIKMGLEKPKFCAYAGGRHTSITENIAKQFGFKWCRTTKNDTKSVIEYSKNDTLYNLPAFMYTNATAGASTYSPVNKSDISYKIGRIVVFHSILSETITDVAYNISWENFKNLVDNWYTQKVNGVIEIMSMSEFYKAIKFPNAVLGQKYYKTEPIDNKQHCYIYTNDGFREITI